ncbi:MAG: S8 family serine peptidase, partial [Sphingobacteriaceae bacterium]
MKKIFTLILLSLTLFSSAQNVNPEYVDGQIFLKFKYGTIKNLNSADPNNIPLDKISILKELITKYGITKAYKPFYQADDDAKLTHILQLEFTKANLIESLIADLTKERTVEYAEKVMLLKTHATPNDPTFPSHLTQIGAQNAWNIWNGTANGNSPITVAIVDNAIAINHVDLTGNVWVNPGEIASNGIDDDSNGYIDDINGWDPADGDNNPIPTNNAMNHGTHCAGIAGARTDNGIGIASIGWNIKIIGVKCAKNTDPTTSVGFGYQGIIYAAKAKARVISCSWGGTGAPSAAAQSIIDYAWNKGCIIIVSAGNDNNSVLHYPAAYNNVYAVAACSGTNVKSSFSCFGTWVDITAPGNNINSTLPGNNYGQQSGTSMACPLVAGLAGLMLSKYPGMTQTDVLNCISTTAANIYTISGNAAYTPNLLGAGRINAFQAMQCAANFTTYPPIANFYALTRNTCPNTNIQFTDSSMYAPTTWTWNFQGGTPATSTSSNPSVMWATPGVYNVTLTAGNANGTNTKIKTSYITVAGPIALPLQEGFQLTQFVPAGWSTYNIDNDSVFWKRKIGVGGFTVNASAACAMFNDYDEDATGMREDIRTPRYNFSNVANARLRFDVAYKQYDNTANITPQNPFSDTLEVRLTTNCGTNWTSIYNKGGQTLSTSPGTLQANVFVPTATEWRRDSIIISSQAGFQSSVMFAFTNRGHYGQAMYVDNINIYLPPPTMSVTSPTAGCTGSAITFTNNTLGAAGYTWSANPAATISAPNGTNTNITFATAGLYTITLVANNGTVTASLTKTISVAVQPTVALTTSSNNICSGTTLTLTASGASTYSWSTSATTSTIAVTPTANTTYTVQGNNANCFQVQSVAINATLTPTVSVTNQTICASGTATLTASGASTYSWSTGSTSNPLLVSPASNT